MLCALKALEGGADGVYVAGCLEGTCHFLEGNIRAKKRVNYLRNELKTLGVEEDRIRMYNLSASQGPRFVEIAHEFTGVIKELGPSPFKKAAA